MDQVVELLSRPINFAVVQLPQRNHPGVVVQGDTLHGLVQNLSDMERLLAEGKLDELSAEIEGMKSLLSEALAHYELICTNREVDLPY